MELEGGERGREGRREEEGRGRRREERGGETKGGEKKERRERRGTERGNEKRGGDRQGRGMNVYCYGNMSWGGSGYLCIMYLVVHVNSTLQENAMDTSPQQQFGDNLPASVLRNVFFWGISST